MANLVIVCGPQAVGKMTVAESLRDKLRYNTMMNHDSIEMSDKIFGFGTPAQKEFNAIFREIHKMKRSFRCSVRIRKENRKNTPKTKEKAWQFAESR